MTMTEIEGARRIRTMSRGPAIGVLEPDAETPPERVPFETPVRVWTGGPGSPQEYIVQPGTYYGIKPAPDYAYYLRNQQEVDLAKQVLRHRYWLDSVPEGEDDLKCETCGWKCRSYPAILWHQNQAHGRPQTSY
jgi:hypothetical protein